jgi:Lipopolysaccharide-assembly
MLNRIRSCWIGLGLLAAGLTVAGCTSTGQFNFLGYTTEPPFDNSIHTVYVPMAVNYTLRRGLEDYLTRAVIREVMLKTPYRTVSCRDGADTELVLKIKTWRKNYIIPTQTNQNRQSEIGFGVEVVWNDLRPGKLGEVLSNPKALSRELPLPGEDVPPTPVAIPLLLLPAATFEPELGGSNAVAEKTAIDRVAVQITSMMEKAW